MKPCKTVGIDVTKRCNWHCVHCYYRYKEWFNTPQDKLLANALQEAQEAKARGCEHVCLIGEGEPSLWPYLVDFITACKEINMAVSIITNGTSPIAKYEKLYAAGMNHMLISAHATGDRLDEIAEAKGSGEKQKELFSWLKANNHPWRANCVMIQKSYQHIPETVKTLIEGGAYHVVLLGFNPHYEWSSKMNEVAVPSAELRPYLETAAREVLNAGKYLTIRYHPMCHIDADLRKYITNALYVLYDPHEWDYGTAGQTEDMRWKAAVGLAQSVGIKGSPCNKCFHLVHCGGSNATFAAGFNGNGLKAIDEKPDQRQGTLFDQNPVNSLKGYL